MPAGRVSKCALCYWRALLEKRIDIDCAAFSTLLMADHFRSFGKWLGLHSGYHKASINIHRYLPFFVSIESKWQTIPNYELLLSFFEAKKLRKNHLPVRWMSESNLIEVDNSLKITLTEKKRILKILATNKRVGANNILSNYYKYLYGKFEQNQLSLRSMRLALTPAAHLLLTAEGNGRSFPVQNDVNAYLLRSPGQQNSLSGFINFLKRSYDAEIFTPRPTSKASLRKGKKVEYELMQLLSNPNTGLMYKQRLLGLALSYFHGLPICSGRRALGNIEQEQSGGLLVAYNEHIYWLPDNFSSLIE